ncbi:MAG: DUF1501 domain-containing protein [Acidimicrobiia bacterium]
MSISRRKFLQLGAGAAGATAFGAGTWAALIRDHAGKAPVSAPVIPDPNDPPTASTTLPTASTTIDTRRDNVLVVLQLSGGFDGLNTLIPDDGRYQDARPNLAIDPAKRIALKGESHFSLHPALAPLASFWDAGHLAAVESVGYTNASRSHFEALDWWWNGAPGPSTGAGWLGRWLDSTQPSTDNPLRAVALGSAVPALIADTTIATVVLSPDAFALKAPKGSDRKALVDALMSTTAPLSNDPLSLALQNATRSTIESIGTFDKLKAAAATGVAAQLNPGRGNDLMTAMTTAAQLVTSGFGTRVVYVNTSGFDTHANQLATHEQLYKEVADSVTAFFDAVSKAGAADKVMLMTVSEFGRRVAENASGGTDHGAANVQFVIGPKVKGGVYGQLDLANLQNGDLRPTIDTRSLYTIGLDWLGADVTGVLDKRYDTLGVI